MSGTTVDCLEEESSKLEVDAREPNGSEMGGGRPLVDDDAAGVAGSDMVRRDGVAYESPRAWYTYSNFENFRVVKNNLFFCCFCRR